MGNPEQAESGTRLQVARALIDQARRQRLAVSDPRIIGQQRDPHPRREYWRNWKRQRAAA